MNSRDTLLLIAQAYAREFVLCAMLLASMMLGAQQLHAQQTSPMQPKESPTLPPETSDTTPLELPPIEQVIPDLTAQDLAFLHAERQKFERLNTVWRLKGQGKLEDAYRGAQALMKALPDWGPAIEAYTNIATEAKRLEEAVTFFEAQVRKHPHRWQGGFGMARVLLAQEKGEAGLEAAQRAIERGCDYWGCFTHLTLAFQKAKQVPDGEKYYRTQLERETADPQRTGLLWLGLGDLLDDDLTRRAEAEEALKQAVSGIRPGKGREKALLSKSNLLRDLGRPQEAIEDARQALLIYCETGNRWNEASALSNLGNAYSVSGNVPLGIRCLKSAVEIQRDVGNRAMEGITLGNLGAAFFHMGAPREAVKYLELALQNNRFLSEGRCKGILLGNLGAAFGELGEMRKSMNYLNQALECYRSTGNRLAERSTLGNLGAAHQVMGDLKIATQYMEEALSVARALGERRGEATQLANLGGIYLKIGAHGTALNYFEQAIHIFQSISDTRDVARILISFGVAARTVGQFQLAAMTSERAVSLSRLAGDRRLEGIAVASLARALLIMGETDSALAHCDEALKIHREVANRVWEGDALNLHGNVLVAQGKILESIADFEQALSLHRAAQDRPGEAMTLGSIGQAYVEGGDFKQGIPFLEQALALNRQIGDPLATAGLTRSLAHAHILQGDTTKAIQLYSEALASVSGLGALETEASLSQGLARALTRTGDRTRAQAHAQHALELVTQLTTDIQDPEQESSYFAKGTSPFALKIRLLSSELPGSPAPPSTPEMLAGTFQLAEEARARSFHRKLQAMHARLTEDAPPELLRPVQEAGFRLNQIRKFFSEPSSSPAEIYALENWLTDQLAPALERQKLLQSPLSPDAVELQRLLNGLQHKTLIQEERNRLLKSLLEAREAAYAQAERALRSAIPAYQRLVEPTLVSLPQVQSTLDDHTVMLAFLLGEDESFAWMLTRAEAKLLHLPPEKEIDAQVQQMRALLGQVSSRTMLLEQARSLYQTLLGQVTDALTPGTSLVIIPDGSLGALPFEALVKPASRTAPDTQRWMALDHPISYAPSATVWWEARQTPQTSPLEGSMLLVGDPLYHADDCGKARSETVSIAPETRAALFGERWSRLCFAGEEVARIQAARRTNLWARIRGQHRTEAADVVLKEAQASESAFRTQALERFSILHFDTHAMAWPDVPLRSAIVLSQQPEQPPTTAESQKVLSTKLDDTSDGYLDLREIMGLRLKSELVVLSACQTAEGRQRRGDGVESLARGFLMAGARRVVASQWKVADESTARFMGRFYRELKQHSVAQALYLTRRAFILGQEGRDVKDMGGRRIRGAFSHPYFWAPFVLIEGSGR